MCDFSRDSPALAGEGNRIWNFAMLGVSMSRPGEGRDPSVSAIALIAAARTLVSALEQRPFFHF